MSANVPHTRQISFRSGRITLALLLAAFALSACAQMERPVTCHTHEVGNGELTECKRTGPLWAMPKPGFVTTSA